MRRQKWMRLVIFVPLLAAVVAACSSDKTAAPTSSTTPVTVPSSSTATINGPTTSVPNSQSAAQAIKALDANPIRVTIATGCPQSVAGHPDYGSTSAEWIDNPDVTDLADRFVPGEPTKALICRYAALGAVTALPDGSELNGGDLYTSTVLDSDAATALANSLDAIEPWDFAAACNPPADKARYTAIVFAIPGRSDVDLWLKDWYGCPEVGNGARSSGELVNGQGHDFLIQLDALAPPAPQQDHPGP